MLSFPCLKVNRLPGQCLACLLGLCALAGSAARADSVDQAEMLLRITATGEHFNQVMQAQTREVIRTYRSIVTSSTGLELPATITEEISHCFISVYDWNNFAAGIAQILATSLDAGELELLLDFFRDRSVPPTRFQDFRRGLDKADLIEMQVADYIFTTGLDCQAQAAELIKKYVALVQPVSSD